MHEIVAPSGQAPAVHEAITELTALLGNRLVTSRAVREQHAHTTTWIPVEPPDVVVYPQSSEDVQQVVRICARYKVPVIPFGTGTSLEGHVNAPFGGVSVDFRDMNRILAVHVEDLDRARRHPQATE
jgi:D-lactate dehydrogenase (cytochrome)